MVIEGETLTVVIIVQVHRQLQIKSKSLNILKKLMKLFCLSRLVYSLKMY